MSEESLRFAAKVASVYARRAIGMAAGGGMAIGLGGAMGSVLMYSTALPPWSADESIALKGFAEATNGLLPSEEAAAQQQQAQTDIAVATDAALLGHVRTAAKRAA